MKITSVLKPLLQPAQTNTLTTLAAGTAVSMGGRMVGRGLLLLLQFLLARALTPALFGLFALSWTFFRLLGIVVPFGMDQAVVRYGAAAWAEGSPAFKGVLRRTLLLALLLGGLAAGLLFGLAPTLSAAFQKPALAPLLRWFSLGLWLWAGLRVLLAASTLTQRMVFAVTIEEILWPGLTLLLAGAALLLRQGVLATAVAPVMALLIALAAALALSRRLFARLPGAHAGATAVSLTQLLAFAVPAMAAFAAGAYLFWMDRLMVGYFLPADQVGIYQAVAQFSLILATILASVNSIFAPMIAALLQQQQLDALAVLFRTATRWGLYLSLPVFLIILFAREALITLTLGPAYTAGAATAVILALAQLINVGTGAVNQLLILAGYQRRWLLTSLLVLLLNVAANAWLIPRWGLVGAAIGTAVAMSLLFGAGLWQTRRLLRLWPYDRRYGKGMAAAAVTAVLLAALAGLGPLPPLAHLLLTVVVSVSVFAAVLLLLGLDGEDRALLQALQARLRGGIAAHEEAAP